MELINSYLIQIISNRSIRLKDQTLTTTTTQSLSGPGSNCHEVG